MIRSHNTFIKLIDDTRHSMAIYDFIHHTVKAPLDYSDLLRWQWVQAVSAFDKLIHDLVKIGMIEIAKGSRPSTSKFNSFQVTLDSMKLMMNSESDYYTLLESHIEKKHSFLSFQEPDKVNEALSLYWNKEHKWQYISSIYGNEERHVKAYLKNIVIRRNQIVHEADYLSEHFDRESITVEDVNDVVEFISTIGGIIYRESKL